LLDQLWETGLPDDELAALAAGLGADAPFFLNGPTALATGVGATLEPLPPLAETWFVLLRPASELTNKTARLYRALTPADWSDGARTLRQAARLRAGSPLEATLLVNVFRRPLLWMFPTVAEAETALLDAGAEVVLPAGSGPTLTAICRRRDEAEALAARLRLGGWSPIVARSL
jgi:4-diphosphocytidyl-2-C-methyl-D-erythritol kinase